MYDSFFPKNITMVGTIETEIVVVQTQKKYIESRNNLTIF